MFIAKKCFKHILTFKFIICKDITCHEFTNFDSTDIIRSKLDTVTVRKTVFQYLANCKLLSLKWLRKNQPWWPSGQSYLLSNSSRKRVLGTRFKTCLGQKYKINITDKKGSRGRCTTVLVKLFGILSNPILMNRV